MVTRRCYGTDSGADDEALVEAFQRQKSKLDAVLSDTVGWFGKYRMRGHLLYLLQRSRDFDIDSFVEGAEMCFYALNEEMYNGETAGAPDFGTMASERIAAVLTQVMAEYEEQGVQMFTASDEPSGYVLHSTKIASIDLVEDAPSPEFGAVDGWRGADGREQHTVEYVHVSVQYKATETLTLVGADGKTVDGSGEPRERTLVYQHLPRPPPPPLSSLGSGFWIGWDCLDMSERALLETEAVAIGGGLLIGTYCVGYWIRAKTSVGVYGT
jgi:hypothetical protein